MQSHLRTPVALLLLVFLFGCGQSGPLFIPGNPSTIQPSAEQAETEDEDEEESANTDEQSDNQ